MSMLLYHLVTGYMQFRLFKLPCRLCSEVHHAVPHAVPVLYTCSVAFAPVLCFVHWTSDEGARMAMSGQGAFTGL